MKKATGEVIVALDFPSAAEALHFLDKFTDDKPYVKVGMELFYAEGPQIIRDIKARGHKLFLDLKLHDIPNTVKGAMGSLSRLDIDMVNVHAAGGVAMMKAALEGVTREDGTRPLVIAVTQLTSTSADTLKNELLINESMEETVAAYAKNARAAGLDGVVCSPLEAQAVKDACGLITVTPGVRFRGGSADDQARFTTPGEARQGGSDYIVMGRPITKADDPVAAYRRAMKEFTQE